jgi:hypothetical protein
LAPFDEVNRPRSGCHPSPKQPAKEPGMSERLLKRRVTDEGTTYMQLLNETRHDWSDNTEVTFLVG